MSVAPPESPQPTLLEQAEGAAERKEWPLAAELLAEAPASTLTRSRRAFYLSRAGAYGDAYTEFVALASEQPREARWQYMAGYQLAEQEQWAKAIGHYSAALRIEPRYVKAWYRLAKACRRAGRDIDAQLAANRVLKLWHECTDEKQRERDAKNMARACYLLARAQLSRDPAGAVELLCHGIEHCPRDANFHYLLGKALRRSGRPKEAIPQLEAADRLAPRKAYQQLELLAALAHDGQSERAGKLLDAAAPHCRGWDAYKAGGLALNLDRPALAVDLLGRAARGGPSRGDLRIAEALQRAEREAPLAATPERRPGHGRGAGQHPPELLTGRIVTVRPERAFGFLEDEQGVRRHFRLKGPPNAFSRGASVRFRPAEEEKGPAARDVQPIG